MARITTDEVRKIKNSFDPKRSYVWKEDDVFEITGKQLDFLYKTLFLEVNQPGGAPGVMTYESYNILLGLIKAGVEQGLIVENDPNSSIKSSEDETV